MSLTQDIANVVQAANNLTSEVTNKMGQIDRRVNEAESEYQGVIAGIRSDFPFYRLSKNQQLKISGSLRIGTRGTPDGYFKRDHIITCQIVASNEFISSNVHKPAEVRAMFSDIKGRVPEHLIYPDFSILRVSTSSVRTPHTGPFSTIYQREIPTNIPYSMGCFIKAEMGQVAFGRPGNIVPIDGKWHERILRFDKPSDANSYEIGPHLYIAPGGRALIALPAIVAGKVPDGHWGFFQKPVFEHEF
ncbi:TPA: hypothetical protein ACGVB5_002478 [Vibrio vulnificus]|nr:hypothetical protein [Vibrio vulnificus]HAS6036141.1 hypothetical protein [Vibrio vulnificus]HAS6354486.1 hypothetical protein [Vibrio vulnificus]HAS6368392.1 hypothetical protein [Vibrio vulnificus]HDY7612193.1 hypothetical protein [Vibrio vulnificus]